MQRPHKEKQHLRAASSTWPNYCKQQKRLKKMSKMTIVQLGVIVFAICLSTQVASQNSTIPTTWRNSTSNTTIMATDTHSSLANTTYPAGAGVSLHAGTVSFLIPVVMAASLLQLYC